MGEDGPCGEDKVRSCVNSLVRPEAPVSRGGELRSFGRRRGRRPSSRQEALLREVLPRVSLDLEAAPPSDISSLFGGAAREVWLEIGFGGGEHLLAQAARHDHVGLIACEPFQDGVIRVLGPMASGAYPNIRLVADDARPLLRWLPAASVKRAFILFPDPWPKLRHHKRRLISEPVLAMLARVMQPGAHLRVATDMGDYAAWILLAARRQGDFQWMATGPRDWRERAADAPPTRYEAKAAAARRHCYYLELRRRSQL